MCWGIFGNINEVCLIGTFTPAPAWRAACWRSGVRPVVCGRVGNFLWGGGSLMGLRIIEGKMNPIREKRQIRKPIMVCLCGLCVFKH